MPQQQTFYQRWIENWWLTEVMATLVSCGLVVALCIVLKHYDGQPVPSLQIGGFGHSENITLGAIVSLLITVSVAASLSAVQSAISQLKWQWYNKSSVSRPLRDLDTLDSASRGLVGSILLLWKLRLAPVAASFGALLVIIHLAIAPITQQAVQQISRQVTTDDAASRATIATAQMWDEQSDQASVHGMPAGYSRLGTGMKGAIPNGLFTNTSIGVNHTVPVCSSGNCKFDNYQSLGICSSVANVTSSGKRTTNGGEGKFCILNKFCVTSDNLANVTSAASWIQVYGDNVEQTGDAADASLNFSSVAFAHQNNAGTIADFYILYLNTDISAEHGNVYAAIEFRLSWCVQTFSTEVINSTASTTLHPDANTNFTLRGPYITNTVSDIPFQVDKITHYSLQRYLWTLFSGAAWEDSAYLKWVDSTEVGVIVDQFGFTSDDSAIKDAPQPENMARLAKIMDNVAISMTNYVRSTADYPVTGTIYVQQIFVKVAWGLIAAPVAFAALCFLLLLSVILSSRFHGDQRPPVWRSGLMPSLRGLDPRLHKTLGGMMAPDVMNEVSQDLLVKLSREGEGWWLLADTQGTGKALPVLSDLPHEDLASSERAHS